MTAPRISVINATRDLHIDLNALPQDLDELENLLADVTAAIEDIDGQLGVFEDDDWTERAIRAKGFFIIAKQRIKLAIKRSHRARSGLKLRAVMDHIYAHHPQIAAELHAVIGGVE